MEKWKVGNWLKIRELLRLGLTASHPACQLAWLLFSILKAELGQILFALSPLSLSLSGCRGQRRSLNIYVSAPFYEKYFAIAAQVFCFYYY